MVRSRLELLMLSGWERGVGWGLLISSFGAALLYWRFEGVENWVAILFLSRFHSLYILCVYGVAARWRGTTKFKNSQMKPTSFL